MKRLLAFLALLVLGIVALRFAVGDETAVSVKASDTGATPGTQQPPAAAGTGLNVQQGTIDATVNQTGPLEFARWRELPEVDGRILKEQVFALKARDSRPIGAGRQQLDQVEVRLFDDGVHTATLTAATAFVALRHDANNRPSLDEGKDIDLRQVVFVTLPGSRLAGLRLELASAKIKIEDGEILLTAPREEPVLLVLEGERSLTLRGRGMQALLPRSRTGALRRADIEILQDPVLTTDGITARSRSRMHYVEDIDSGAGTLTVDDHVELDLARADIALPGTRPTDGAVAPGNARIRGDQFVGWLQRHRERDVDGRERQQVQWRQLVLTGAPATVDVPGGRLTTPKITVLPGLFGEPMWVTAHGGASQLEQTELRPGSKQTDLVVGTSQRRIHFVMPREHVGALHRSFGFPRWSMRPLEQLQVVVVEGAARLHGGARTCDASDGMRIYRRDGGDRPPKRSGDHEPGEGLEDPARAGRHGIVRGLGNVRVEQRATTPNEKDLVATGNDGFALTIDAPRELLQLGPPAPDDLDAPGPWRDHTFDVRHGDATMQGRGVCEVERIGETTRVDFVSPDGRIVARLPHEGLQMQRVRRLQGTFLGNEATELDVAGWPTEVTHARGNDTMSASAPRLLQIGPRSLRLLPADASSPSTWSGLAAVDRMPVLRRTIGARGKTGPQQIEVRGPSIDVHHAGGHDVLIDAVAVGDELPHVYARLERGSESKDNTTIACAAERLRVLPFLLSPEMRDWLVAGDRGAFARVVFHGLSRPWLLVDEVREFQLDDPRHGHVEGRGKQLLVSQGGRAALFVGDPDALTPAVVTREHADSTITLQGARVRMFDDEDVKDVRLNALGTFADRSTFLTPSMTLHEAGRTGLLAHMRASCQGNIEVLPGSVVFGGPVHAHGLRPDGSFDPNGLGIDANELQMVRSRDTGEVVKVLGKGVVVDWTRLNATCAEVELDVLQKRLIASGPDDATVTLPGGREIRAPRIEVNYETLTWRMSSGRVEQRAGEGIK